MSMPEELKGFSGSLAMRVYEALLKRLQKHEEFGMISLEIPQPLTFVEADKYYPIPGTFSVNPALLNNFELSSDGKLTYTGEGKRVVIGGTTDLQISGVGVAKVTYGLFKNDEVLPRAETPHDFEVVNSHENFSVTGADIAEKGDVYQVYAQCDDAGRTINPTTLNVIFA